MTKEKSLVDDFARIAFVDGDFVETLWAKPEGDDRYCLDNAPWDAYGVSCGDTVEARPPRAGELPHFVRVIRKSGNRTVRLILDPPVREGGPPPPVLAELRNLGCTYEGAGGSMFSINIPPAVDLERVRQLLIAAGVDWEHADPTYEELFPS